MLLKCISTFITMTMLLVSNIHINVPDTKEQNFTFVENKKGYIAYLRIPSINLSQPLYNDEKNNIDKNIIFVNGSDNPNKEKGNVIIAGHSGASSVSYFKYLYRLKVGDLVYLEYNDKIYKYQIDNRYFVNKTGSVEVIRDNNIKTLTLVTCYGKDKQLVLIGNIVK